MLELRPVIEGAGFKCLSDGERGGFSILEGPVHFGFYQLWERGTQENVGVSIRANLQKTEITISESEDGYKTGLFTTTRKEILGTRNVVSAIQRFAAAHVPKLSADVKFNDDFPPRDR
jgi:hypothetical protein